MRVFTVVSDIDCKILLANCFSLPSMKKENSIYDLGSLRGFLSFPCTPSYHLFGVGWPYYLEVYLFMGYAA